MDSKSTAFLAVALVIGLAIGAAAGFFLWGNNGDTGNDDETYWFYLNFGEGSEKNGWYSGTGADATEGFDSAMVKAGMSYEISGIGYIGTIDGQGEAGWYIASYVLDQYDADAQNGSIAYPVYSYGAMDFCNGWMKFSGYDWESATLKLSQSASTVFYMSIYNADWTVSFDPVTDNGWMNSGPFAGAATA